MRTRSVLTIGLAVAVFAFTGCGDDDGGGVREVGDGSGTGTASGSGTASATGTGTGSGSATGSGSGSGSGSGAGHGEEVECRPVGDMATAATTVNVELDEWTIVPSTGTAPAGNVAFVGDNVGEEPHELVIVRGAAADLPVDDDGALAEDRLLGGALVGEIEPFPAGETCDGTFELSPGEYTLVCNVVEEEEGHVHLEEGMVTSFTVT
jgi:hypothetical protein